MPTLPQHHHSPKGHPCCALVSTKSDFQRAVVHLAAPFVRYAHINPRYLAANTLQPILMKKYVLLLPLLLLAGAIIGTLLLGDQGDTPDAADKGNALKLPPHELAQFDGIDHKFFQLANDAAVTHEHLQLIPIRASNDYLTAHSNLPQLLSLKAALATRQVVVRELGESTEQQYARRYHPNPLHTPIWTGSEEARVSDELSEAMASGASVNSLVIENHSDTAIYIMAGEVVQGGKQDRVIAEDVIAMPGEKYVVPVFCVEPGRWEYHSAPTHPQAKDDPDAIYAFTGYFNVASNSIRQTVKLEKNQGEVWARVGDVRNRNAVQGKSTTYGELAQSQRFAKAQQRYAAAFQEAFAGQNDVVGVMAVSGSKVLAVDIFATPQLFQQQYEGLMHAYFTEAITYGDVPQLDAKGIQKTFEEAQRAYFTRQQEEEAELAAKFVRDGKVVHFAHLPQ